MLGEEDVLISLQLDQRIGCELIGCMAVSPVYSSRQVSRLYVLYCINREQEDGNREYFLAWLSGSSCTK